MYEKQKIISLEKGWEDETCRKPTKSYTYIQTPVF